uniref:Uncharacterized protein n=1 Tax=Pithovirus LCDPAC01 TaxID=2506600 RepID=A0A481YPG0_9VIRU|nr:MAG: hypothetical protein LCDPAC01_01630 [Pithovirus LCDPAC01]
MNHAILEENGMIFSLCEYSEKTSLVKLECDDSKLVMKGVVKIDDTWYIGAKNGDIYETTCSLFSGSLPKINLVARIPGNIDWMTLSHDFSSVIIGSYPSIYTFARTISMKGITETIRIDKFSMKDGLDYIIKKGGNIIDVESMPNGTYYMCGKGCVRRSNKYYSFYKWKSEKYTRRILTSAQKGTVRKMFIYQTDKDGVLHCSRMSKKCGQGQLIKIGNVVSPTGAVLEYVDEEDDSI